MESVTLAAYTEEYHRRDPMHVPNDKHDRLWFHDMLHAILGTDILGAKGEEITGVYQSVLINDCAVNPLKKKHENGKMRVSVEAVHNQIVPDIHAKYLKKLGQQQGFTTRRKLGWPGVKEYYARAQILKQLIDEMLGKELGEIPVSELKQMPAQPFLDRVREMENLYQSAIGSPLGRVTHRYDRELPRSR